MTFHTTITTQNSGLMQLGLNELCCIHVLGLLSIVLSSLPIKQHMAKHTQVPWKMDMLHANAIFVETVGSEINDFE